jgi:exopolysaccharide production protein ExoQ
MSEGRRNFGFVKFGNRRRTPIPRGMVYDGRLSFIVTGAIWLLIAFMIVPDGFDYSTEGSMPTEGSAVSRVIWIALLAFGVLVVLWRAALARLVLRQINPFILLFVLLATASVLWSIDAAVTVRRVIRVLTIVLDSLAFVLLAWQAQRFQQVVRSIVTIVLFGSIFFVLVAPNLAIEQSNKSELLGAWKGLATTKNLLGSVAGLGFIFWLHGGLAKEVRPAALIAGVLASLLCLVMSRSSTSAMATVFAAMLLLLLLRSPHGFRRYSRTIVGLFAALLLMYSMAMLKLVPGLEFLLAPITIATGKDLSFTGRTDIWQVITAHIQLRPYLGDGFGAYWTGNNPLTESYEMVIRLYFYPTEGHNGYLDVTNDLGFAGMLCLLGYLILYLRQCMRLLTVERTQAALYLALFFQQLILNLSESCWFNGLRVEFVVMTLATFAMGRDLVQRRFSAFFPEPRLRASAAVRLTDRG